MLMFSQKQDSGEPFHQRLCTEVPLDLRLLCSPMFGGAGGQFALLVLGRIGLGARIDQASAESRNEIRVAPWIS